jgi:hypothetical protein
MLRCTAAFATVLLTAILLGLLEPVLTASDAVRLFLIFLLLVFLRSPLWLTSFIANGRTGRI